MFFNLNHYYLHQKLVCLFIFYGNCVFCFVGILNLFLNVCKVNTENNFLVFSHKLKLYKINLFWTILCFNFFPLKLLFFNYRSTYVTYSRNLLNFCPFTSFFNQFNLILWADRLKLSFILNLSLILYRLHIKIQNCFCELEWRWRRQKSSAHIDANLG